jgi:hypothetical protein
VTPGPGIGVYVSIGNHKDGLTQYQWSRYVAAAAAEIDAAGIIQATLFSPPTADWQTACWCVEIQPGIAERLQEQLVVVCREFGQDAIGWAEVPETLFLR